MFKYTLRVNYTDRKIKAILFQNSNKINEIRPVQLSKFEIGNAENLRIAHRNMQQTDRFVCSETRCIFGTMHLIDHSYVTCVQNWLLSANSTHTSLSRGLDRFNFNNASTLSAPTANFPCVFRRFSGTQLEFHVRNVILDYLWLNISKLLFCMLEI